MYNHYHNLMTFCAGTGIWTGIKICDILLFF